MDFRAAVDDQVSLLEAGAPLDAFDRYFADDGVMLDNDVVFGSGKAECRAKQEPFISAAKAIDGRIVRCTVDDALQICVFHNQSTFVTKDDERVQIDGLHWQRWAGGKIVEERYYRGELMRKRILAGILERPGALAL